MKFDKLAFRSKDLTGLTALVMLLSSGTLAWSGSAFKNPYTPRDTDPVDREPTTRPAPAVKPTAVLKRTEPKPLTVQIAPAPTTTSI